MLDLWPYKVCLKKRAGAIAKELHAPKAKLAIRAAIGAGRNTMISTRRCTSSASSPATQGPSTWGSTAIFCRRREPRRRHDADRAVAVLLPVPHAGNPREADAATQHHVRQMLAVLVEVPERWRAREAELSDLVEVLSAQQQSLAVGESVYLASIPVAACWHHPRSLRPVRPGRPLVAWAPGRDVEAGPTQ